MLCANPSIVKRISKEIVELRIKGSDDQISEILQLINALDEKEIFFSDHLSPTYSEIMAKHYKSQSTENYEKMTLK